MIALARSFDPWAGGGAADVVAGCIVMTALGLTSVVCAVDTEGGVATGVDSKAVADGTFWTTWLVTTVLGAALSVTAAEEDAGELAVALAGLDDDQPHADFACLGVSSAPVVSAVFCIPVDALWVRGSDDT
jgi:hypothetical protein